MLEEGQKQKVQTQQTGEFINYDLIQKKRYSHPYTHYYLQQAPQQSLAIFYGTNDYTLQQVQQIKQRHKQQRLQQHNYKMLDLMFKLPQDYQKLQDQIEKQIEKQHDDIQPDIEMQFQKGNLVHNDGQQYKQQRQQQIVAEKGLATFNGSNDIGAINNKQKIISNSQGNVSVHQNVSSQIQQYQGNQNNLITQNQKPLIAPTPPGDIDFVEIKKKKTTKKKPTLSNQQKPITQEKPIQQQHSINANNNKNMLQNLQQHDQDPNVNNNQQPQKRKYIRKKPIEPKKPKTQKSKLSISQNVNKEINVQQQQRNNQPNNNNLLGETINNVQGEPVKQPNIKQLLAIKKQASQKQQKDKKPKKPKKSTTILALTNDNQNTLTQTKKSPLIEEQIQIMLPCEQQVKELQREMIELNKNLQDQKIMFEKNMHQVEELRSRVQAGDEIKEQGMGLENQRECQEMYLKGGSNKMGEIGGVQKMMDIIESQLKGQQSDVLINKDDLPLLSNNENNQYHLQQPPRQYPRIQTTQLTEVAQQQTSKKQKQSSKVGIYKKQSKKSSSQSYKPQQDQLQSISQIQNNGKVLILNQDDDDHKSINNSKKDIKKHYVQHQKKRKYTKKKGEKELLTGEKELLTGEKKQQSVNNIINNNNQSYTQSVNNNPLSQNNQSQTVNLNNNNNSLSSAQNNILSQSTNKQKKPKLTGQQRQRMKLQKQRLKQMRLKQKQERKKLKQLQKMEKQTIKLANKMSEKSINNIISSRSKQLKENVNNGSVIANVIANVSVNANANVNANVSVSGGMLHGDNNIDPQHLIPNIVSNDNNNSNYNNSNSNNNNNNNNINNNNNTNNSQIDIHNEKNLQIDQKPKPFLNNVLNESIGNNSTKEDIKINTSFDFITNLVHKQVDLLQQMKKEQQQQKQQQIEYGKLKRNYPFVNTAADNNNNNNNNNDDPLDILNQQYQILNQQYQTDKYLQNNTPKKRLKLISKQSQQYQQPHYYAKQQLSKQQQSNSINNINNHPSNKFLIQVFGHIIDNQQNHQSKCQSKQQQKGKQHYQQIILNDQIILQKQLLEKQNAYKEQSSSLHQ